MLMPLVSLSLWNYLRRKYLSSDGRKQKTAICRWTINQMHVNWNMAMTKPHIYINKKNTKKGEVIWIVLFSLLLFRFLCILWCLFVAVIVADIVADIVAVVYLTTTTTEFPFGTWNFNTHTVMNLNNNNKNTMILSHRYWVGFAVIQINQPDQQQQYKESTEAKKIKQ